MADISIITVCKNAERWLSACIDSVAAQTVDVEHILVDGGSTDSTMDIVYSRKAHFSHIVSEPDHGIYDAMNKGVTLATGEIVGILNSDDYYADGEVLADVCKEFQDPNAYACYGDLEYVSARPNSRVTRRWVSGEFGQSKFLNGWMPPHPTLFLRKSVYEQFGLYREDMGTSADYELMLRIFLKHGLKARYLRRCLVYMRVGGLSNRSLSARIQANKFDALAWKANDIHPKPWTLMAKPLRKLPQWLNW